MSEPLTSERLAEIENLDITSPNGWIYPGAVYALQDLLAERKRLLVALAAAEAREAALREASRQMLDALERAHKRSVLSKTALLLLNDAGATLRRALLAATEAVEGEE